MAIATSLLACERIAKRFRRIEIYVAHFRARVRSNAAADERRGLRARIAQWPGAGVRRCFVALVHFRGSFQAGIFD
jgi:hypothetical protein